MEECAPVRNTSVRALIQAAAAPGTGVRIAAAARAAASRSACSDGSKREDDPSRRSSRFTPTAPASTTAATVAATASGESPYPASMSADTGSETAAAMRLITAAARSAPRPAPSGTPSDQATPALVVAIAFAPAAAIATAEATSQAFASNSGSPARCRLAKSSAWRACPVVNCVVMPITLTRSGPVSSPHPDANQRGLRPAAPIDQGLRATAPVRGFGAGTAWLSGSDCDDQLVVDLSELDDLVRELAGDQVAVGRRAGVRAVGGLIGEVLDEQQVVRLGRVPVHPERQGAVLGPRPLGRELLHDRLDRVLHAVLELDREYLHQHGDLSSGSRRWVQQQGSTRWRRRVWPDPDTMIGGSCPDPASDWPDP